jgi:peptide deformylase
MERKGLWGMKLPLAYYGNPILRQKGVLLTEINDDIRQLVSDMIETMQAHNGVGLAAPQVKRSLALFITCGETNGQWDLSKLRVFINPKIISYSDTTRTSNEGCLSIPKLYGDVLRPIKIMVTARDMEWNEFSLELENLEATVFLHENDHINGVLFIDRMHGKHRREMEPQLKEIKRKYRS